MTDPLATGERPVVLVLGVSGMMGHMAYRVFSKHFNTFGTSRGNYEQGALLSRFVPAAQWISGVDITNFESVDQVIRDLRPDVVFNAVGVVKQLESAHDPLTCIPINSLLPHQLAKTCGSIGSRLIHMSTDCVFSGQKGYYTETDNPDPVDLYGRTKLVGECEHPAALTVRTSIIGRQVTGNTSLLEWAISQRGKQVRGFTRAIYTGLTTEALSKVLVHVIKEHSGLRGVYQIASTSINKYDLLVKVNEALALNLTISPDDSFTCDRSLNGTRFLEATGITVPTWEEMIAGLAADSHQYDGTGSSI